MYNIVIFKHQSNNMSLDN